jgi:putative addiction module component (TIGR02574 family)
MSSVSIQEIKKLSVAERIILTEKIWETIPDKSEELALTGDQAKE